MIKQIKRIMPAIVCIICVFFIVMITFRQIAPIKLIEVNPAQIVAGESFNLYEGQSTMSLNGVGFQTGDIIYLNGFPQDSAVGDATWMTCFVQSEVYEKEGELEIQVKRINEKGRIIKKSNKLKINIVRK